MTKSLLVLLAACGSGVHSGTGTAIDWQVGTTTIDADSFTANVEGVTFHALDPMLRDQGSSGIFEADWTEQSYMQRFHLDFTMTSPTWCITSVRIYNLAYTDWHEQNGNLYCAQIGSAWDGNFDVTMADGTRITMPNAHVAPYGAP